MGDDVVDVVHSREEAGGLARRSPTARPTTARTVAPTPLPTPGESELLEETWTVYFTDGKATESYVWYIGQEDKEATVLVDTTGWATGIAVSANGTTIYFGDEMGSVWSVAPTGYELIQLATADDMAWSPGGLAYNDYSWRLYFVDTINGGVWACAADGTDMHMLIAPPDDASMFPFDVALDTALEALLVSRPGAHEVHKYHADTGGDLGALFSDLESEPLGLAFDGAVRKLYWAAGDAILASSLSPTPGDGVETIYGDLVGATSVAVSGDDLFFVLNANLTGAVYFGDLSGAAAPVKLSKGQLLDARFVTAARQHPFWPTAPPTPGPTPRPTLAPMPGPTPAPSPYPSYVPSPYPSYAPTPAPSAVPTAGPTRAPAPVPTPGPTFVPTSTPTRVPVAVPTPGPTPVPTGTPTRVPAPVPTPGPTPAPTRAPSPYPSYAPTPVPSAVPTTGPTPVPSTAHGQLCANGNIDCTVLTSEMRIEGATSAQLNTGLGFLAFKTGLADLLDISPNNIADTYTVSDIDGLDVLAVSHIGRRLALQATGCIVVVEISFPNTPDRTWSTEALMTFLSREAFDGHLANRGSSVTILTVHTATVSCFSVRI